MKIKVISLLLIVFTCISAKTQHLKIYYLNPHHEKVYLTSHADYDTENKPNLFFLDKPDIHAVYCIEVFRVIGPEQHFYKSWTLADSELEKGFNISSLFSDVTSPFIHPSAIVFKICKTNKQKYLKLKQREDCEQVQQITLNIPG